MTENPIPSLRREFPGAGQAVLLVAIFLGVQMACGAVVLVAMSVVAAVRKTGGAAPELPPVALLAGNAIAFAVVAAWALTATRGRWREIFLGGRGGAAPWLATLPLLLGTTLLVTAGSNLMQQFLPVPAALAKVLEGAMDTAAHPVVAVLLVVVLAPIGEEFLFRAIMLRGLLVRMRPWRAIWLTTLLFAVMHLNPWQIPAAVGFGVLCGWIYLRTRSLGLCILVHLLNNAAAVFADRLPWLVPGLTNEPGQVEQLPTWVVLGAVASLTLGWALFRRATNELMGPPPLPVTERTSAAGESALVDR